MGWGGQSVRSTGCRKASATDTVSCRPDKSHSRRPSSTRQSTGPAVFALPRLEPLALLADSPSPLPSYLLSLTAQSRRGEVTKGILFQSPCTEGTGRPDRVSRVPCVRAHTATGHGGESLCTVDDKGSPFTSRGSPVGTGPRECQWRSKATGREGPATSKGGTGRTPSM